MKKRLLITWILIVGATTCFSSDYTQDAFMKKIQTVESPEAAGAVFCDFVKNAPDMEFAHQLYQMWKINDQAEAEECMDQIRKTAEYADRVVYFDGADRETLPERIAYSRGIIEKNPDAYAAYALMFDTYTTWLFKKPLNDVPDPRRLGVSPEELELLEKDFFPDNARMVRIREWKDAGEYIRPALKYMAYYAVYKERHDEALRLFAEAEALNADWLDYSHAAVMAARMKQTGKVHDYISKSTAQWIDRGVITDAQKDALTENMTMYALVTGKAYDEAIAYISGREQAMADADTVYMLAGLYALKGDPDKAFETLDTAVAKGFNNIEILEQDTELEPLHSDPRWNAIVEKVRAEWEKGETGRAKTAVEQKIDRDAPAWELKDPDGKTWKLSDYKGKKIVILDFWATWCGPCKIAMPELNEWTRKHKPDNVEVFCINAWERNPEEAKKYFADEKYVMHLLLNGDEVGKAYGLQGIPYLCVIDKEGKIRFESKGYSPDLKKNLTYWIADLSE
jgi:thiol-disulfide isomerase/thioredoxin/tRNA splicing endonuclease